MMNVLYRKVRVNDGFGISKVALTKDKKEDKERGKTDKKFEDVELRALLNEDDSKTQKQLAD